jgi:hypothetical protein
MLSQNSRIAGPRFTKCSDFAAFNAYLTKLEDKKNKLSKEVAELEEVDDPQKKEYLALTKNKYKVFLDLVENINLLITKFNNMIPTSTNVEDKVDQYNLTSELFFCFLESIQDNIKTLVQPRDNRKRNMIFLFFGAIPAAVAAAASAASFTWPVVLLSAYLADRTCLVGSKAAGFNTNILKTDSIPITLQDAKS